MFLSMNWISDFVCLDGLDKEALVRRFTLSAAEVEDIYYKGKDTRGVIVAKIVSVENHPNSKKLHLLKIDTGNGITDCVCGAPNVREGMKVAFATAGGAVCGHEITRATVAGYESNGMCCSEAELDISADNSGIMEIFEDVALGTDIKEIYDIEDLIFEVDNKSLTNRPDLWGHFGIAREIAVLAERPLKTPALVDEKSYEALPSVDIDIKDKELCYRYIGTKAENITVKTSPVNMKIRLHYCGLRAINLLADLTNYVMLELGQPMHAFDLRRVDRIRVQRFDSPFKFKTLDGTERNIDENTLMICRDDEPVAVAGIMGGLDSEIEDDTSSLLLESATFDGVSIRKSSTRIGLRTDASMRYEKMLDPELAMFACKRFLYLLCEIDKGAKIISRITDSYVKKYDTIVLEINKSFVDRYTGIDISSDRIEKTLTSLGFGVVRNGDSFTVTVPSYRATKDVTIKADLIEEITRIYGYDNFEIFTAKSELAPIKQEVKKTDEDRAKDILVSKYALSEVHSYIWFDRAKNSELGIETGKNVRIINAQTPEHDTLRSTMTPTLLNFLNENKGYADSFGIFEVGKVVKGLDEKNECDERKTLGVALYTREQSEEEVFLRVRDIVTTVCRNIKHKTPDFVSAESEYNWQHPKNTFDIVLDGKKIGFLSVPHPSVIAKLDKKAGVAFADIDMNIFSGISASDVKYVEASKFPSIEIDLCFNASLSDINFGDIKRRAFALGGEYITDISVSDIYESAEASNITFRFTFSSKERTLAKAELTPITDAIIADLSGIGLSFKAV